MPSLPTDRREPLFNEARVDQCDATSDVGDECVGESGHAGGHMTAPDEHGMVAGWGYAVPDGATEAPCPALCGFSMTVTPGMVHGITHRNDGGHTITDADGQEATMHVTIDQPRHLRTVPHAGR